MTKDSYHALIQPPEPGKPLIFAFHGTGGDERQFVGLVKSLAPGAGIVSLRGDVSEMGALRFFRRTGEGVYDMDDLAVRTEKMTGFVQAVRADFPDAATYGFGYSNGANILAAVALKRPDLFDRIGLLHPLIPWDPGTVPGLEAKKVLITAGERDPITPWDMSAALIDWFRAQGSDVETEVHSGGHELRQTELDALANFLAA